MVIEKNSRYLYCCTAKTAFTLGEILITLAVIGVVSVLTIIPYIYNLKDSSMVNKVKKTHHNLSNAVLMSISENSDLSSWGITNDANGAYLIANNIKPYLKIRKDCGIDKDATKDCQLRFSGLNNSYSSVWFADSYKYYNFISIDGTLIQIRPSSTCNSINDVCFSFGISINDKRPQVLGKNVFLFVVYANGKVVPSGVNSPMDNSNWANCNRKSEGWLCAAWVVYKGNLDYLYCDSLSWTGKSKCR